MQNDIEVLKALLRIDGFSNDEEEALQKAIKCMQLVPELVEALEQLHPMNDDEPCHIYELYIKAKELIGDE